MTNPLALIGCFILALALGFGSGWEVNGWRKDSDIQKIKAERAHDSATQASAALEDLAKASKTIKDAADQYSAIDTTFGAKLDAIRKELKDVKAKIPLPFDCHPDTGRLRNLKAAVDATNQANSGQ